jgi:hypothetical protein
MARLYADEDFSAPVIERLRQLGHDILTAQEAGRAGQGITDAEVIAFAMTMGRATVTLNGRRFLRPYTAVPSHADIVVSTRDLDMAELADRIHRQLQSTPTLPGHLLRINRPSS